MRDDGLVVDVKKTSNKKAYPKGQSLIPRADVWLIGLRKRGAKYRAIFTTGGIVVGAGLGLAVGVAAAGGALLGGGREQVEIGPVMGLGSGLGGALNAGPGITA